MNTLLNQLSIKAKLILLVGTNIVFFLIASLYAIAQMNAIGSEIEGIAERDLPLIDVVSEITSHTIEMEVMFERATRFGALLDQEHNATQHFKEAIAEFHTLASSVEEEILKGEELANRAHDTASSEDAKAEFGKIFENLSAIDNERRHFQEQADKAFTLLEQGNLHKAEQIIEEVEAAADRVAHELEATLEEIKGFTNRAALIAEEHEHTALMVLVSIVSVSILIATTLAFFMINNIKACLSEALGAMHRMASGDFSKAVHSNSKDELGAMLNGLEGMRQDLVKVIGEIESSSQVLSAASEQLAAASEESSQSVYQQKQETEQLATAINEMAATVQEVANSSTGAAGSAHRAMAESQHGRSAVNETIHAINTLSEGVQRSADAIAKLGEESNNIGMVLDVIRGIAEQTNLLALNAAIEAARAGEQGRGFAVVADEVRTLATRTHDSTQEIQSMIERLQGGARESSRMMEESRTQMEQSVSKATEAGEVLEIVLDAVTEITDKNNQIASAAEQQSAVTEELNQNVSVIADVAEQNAATSSQTAQSSTELAETAVALKEMISRFKLA